MFTKILITIFILASALWIAPTNLIAQSESASLSQQVASAIDLIQVDGRLTEKDIEKLTELPAEAIFLLVEQLNKIPRESSDRGVFDLLAFKLTTMESRLAEAELSHAVEALLSRVDINASKWEPQRKATALSGIKDPRVREVVAKIQGRSPTAQLPTTSDSIIDNAPTPDTTKANTPSTTLSDKRTDSKSVSPGVHMANWGWAVAGGMLLLIAVLGWKLSRK